MKIKKKKIIYKKFKKKGGEDSLILENLGKKTAELLFGNDKKKEREREEREREEERKREEEMKREEKRRSSTLLRRLMDYARFNRSKNTVQTSDNIDVDKNKSQLTEDVIWTNIIRVLNILIKNKVIDENVMRIKDNKVVKINKYGFALEVPDAKEFINILNKNLSTIIWTCFRCTPQIIDKLNKLESITKKMVSNIDTDNLNEIYGVFLDLCIQYCSENCKKHKMKGESEEAKKYEESMKEIEKIKIPSTGGKNIKKKGKATKQTNKTKQTKQTKTKQTKQTKTKQTKTKQTKTKQTKTKQTKQTKTKQTKTKQPKQIKKKIKKLM